MHDLRIKTGDIQLQVREYPGNGETIIFLHFGDANLMMWDGVAPHFQGWYRRLVDLRVIPARGGG